MCKKMKHKILIANRGEIARRIARTLRTLNLPYAVLLTEEEKGTALHRESNEAVFFKSSKLEESYLNIEAVIEAAKLAKCTAVHPGYGFLSENPDFAEALKKEKISFIGPSSETIRILGDKQQAKELAQSLLIPTLPSVKVSNKASNELLKEAKQLGYPLLIKAAGGGGGRGMRVIEREDKLLDGISSAKKEAEKFFNNEEVYIEKYLPKARHIEVQILGDGKGKVISLGTRECSIQRRRQKLVEEAQASIPKKIKRKLEESAKALGEALKYRSAGTVEFLVNEDSFYFIEANTRIQVEHPVTEAVYGVDLVAQQVEILTGAWEPKPLSSRGHAIEFRINCEDPFKNFMPSTGVVEFITDFNIPWLREDRGIEAGEEVSGAYDSLISKAIVKGKDREEAIYRSRLLFDLFTVEGVSTTIPFFRWLLRSPSFLRSEIDVNFVEREFTSLGEEEKKVSPPKRDYLYQKPIGGAEVKTRYKYQSKRYGTEYTIEVTHRTDGFFLAVPVDERGRKAPVEKCRMSNGLKSAITAVIGVLENTPPKELFEEHRVS
ncbi:MAG: ATP-grasp domain-containing protein [Candidatus Dadabacteria bacterium]|nr:MAG: ATP-grasp domain-containing protein [Candidatus Dadabacteria bacterium]